MMICFLFTNCTKCIVVFAIILIEREIVMFRKKLVEQPLGYWEEKSYMMAIPKSDDEDILKVGIERLTSSEEFTVKDTSYDVSGVVTLKILYDKDLYEVGMYLGGISVPEYYLSRNFLFSEEEKEALLAAKKSLTVFMEFNENAKKSFHFQLKVILTLIPDLIGVMDESAEKMLPARWVKMAATSKVLPSARDLFNVQAVSSDDGKVWLHTHGLCRSRITELEILESPQDLCQQYYNLITTYAMYLLDKKEPFEPRYNGAYIGNLINGNPIVVTCVPWMEGIKEYKKLKLGNAADRKNGHNSKTSIIFLYTSEEEENKHILNKVSIYEDLWSQNPLFFFSDEETERMKSLAMERFSYVKEAFKNKENSVLIKIGLPLKEEGKFEHIWFELLEIKGKKFQAKLTQEPYDVPSMHTGDIAWYTLDDVTDWMIYTKDVAINPSNAYLLEK